jgi:hypothetical protein
VEAVVAEIRQIAMRHRPIVESGVRPANRSAPLRIDIACVLALSLIAAALDVYLLQYPERAMSRGMCAVAAGDLTAGGLTFGLLRDGLWSQHVNIVEHGRFIAAGCAPDEGNYSIVLANDMAAGTVATARLEKIGCVEHGLSTVLVQPPRADSDDIVVATHSGGGTPRETVAAISNIAWIGR